MSDKPEALKQAEFCDGNVLYHPAAAELRRLHAECEEWRKLRDPATLHVNLLRGIPARLDDATLWHMAGGDQKVAAAVAHERERCAKLCETLEAAIWQQYKKELRSNSHTEGRSDGAGECAAAIRATPTEPSK